ncbi:MAG: class I SAM-dependent methyltransferase family protein [Candidatus Woesearchaeota archaeon]
MKLKELLRGKLDEKELALVPSSFDIVGDIAIFSDMPEELKNKEKIIGSTMLENFKNIRVVAKKVREYSGEYRTPKLKIIAGEKRKETTYKENGCTFKLDVEKVYFSPRLAEERKRIAGLVTEGEKVLVMFSGCAPYPLIISKNSKAESIYGIEKNPTAHRYALKNVEINKAKNVFLILGDARDEAFRLAGEGLKFDRIIMPLPKDSGSFLDACFAVAKPGTIVHFYSFMKEEEIPKPAVSLIREEANKLGVSVKILGWNKCGHYAPGRFRVCIDFKITSKGKINKEKNKK